MSPLIFFPFVLLIPSWKGLWGRFRREARTRRDRSTSQRKMVRKRLTSVGRIEKHMHDLSDEVLCARWVENPYYQFFCGELSFCHQLPFDRSSMTHWRQRLGEEQLVALLQESLSMAHKTGAFADAGVHSGPIGAGSRLHARPADRRAPFPHSGSGSTMVNEAPQRFVLGQTRPKRWAGTSGRFGARSGNLLKVS